MRRIALLTLLVLIQWKAHGQRYSLNDFNLEGDIGGWYEARFDSINIKPYIGPFPSVSPPLTSTNSFFIESNPDWNLSSIMYDHQLYHRVRVKYDIHSQMAYLFHPLYFEPLVLNQELVNWISTPKGIFKPQKGANGYYLIIYDGKNISLTKESTKRLVIDNRELEYAREDEFYLLTTEKKIRIRNAKSYIKQFPTHKREIKRFMRLKSSRIIRRTGKENFLIHLAEYCDNFPSS